MDIVGYLKTRRKPALSFGGCIALLAVFHFVIFHNHWLARSWFPYDFPAGYYATVAYWVASLQSGEWPQWIPYQSMGYPLLMNPQMGFFYPPFWIFVVLRIPFTLHAAVVTQILHVLFGSIGFLLLANRLFQSLLPALCGAAAFLLFGGFYTNAEHADIVRGFSWIPWLLWSALLLEPRLQPRNLALPALLACFITGAYTGQVIAGVPLLAAFLVLQAAPAFFRKAAGPATRNLLLQFALLACGVLLASPFLLPGAALAMELTRARQLDPAALAWLTGKNFFDLIFPSTLINPGRDASMWGMQIPAVLLVFLPLIELKFLKRLIPFLAIAALACLLSFQAFSPLSIVLRHLVPPLGLSRFPTADYREFLYLAILLLSTGGLASALRSAKGSDAHPYGASDPWRKTAAALLVATLFAVFTFSCLRHNVSPASLSPFLDFAKRALLAMLGTALLLLLGCLFHRPNFVAIGLLPLLLVVSLPVLEAEKTWWAEPDLPANLYGQAFPLEVNGELRTRSIFRRHQTSRSPREIADNHHILSWWGYLNGAYLTNDSGGVIPLTRRTAESNPALLRFILDPSRLLQVPCQPNAAACLDAAPLVDLSNRPSAGAALQYGRNRLAYAVDVPGPSLVVENEMAIPGWHIVVDGHETPMRKVNGCLRGWLAPAGKHRVQLRYQTPMLLPGLFLAAAALAAWITALWLRYHRSVPQNSLRDCVILVSSDRTGG